MPQIFHLIHRFLGKKQAGATLQRSEAMIVPEKRFESNKKAVLLDQEKNHYFVFSLYKI
ncbi:hypothetical protein [Exiguobacterium sp. KRL4]|uniref:hypothetical protein n=1 Tax=Exiguobacterium sp. KRL4 TaxID=1914536 RepID=UPI000A67AE17|nr:hypothetical protein [Exiguobacterium sp. KRL4]